MLGQQTTLRLLPASQRHLVVGDRDAESLGGLAYRRIQAGVGERVHIARLLVDEVMVMVIGVNDLIARDPVATVEAIDEPKRQKLMQDPVDRGRGPARPQLGNDLLSVDQALTVARKQFDDRPTRRSRAMARVSHAL